MRMHQMTDQGITRFPGDDATAEQYLTTMPSRYSFSFHSSIYFIRHFLETLELLVRSSVFYIQEVGMHSSKREEKN